MSDGSEYTKEKGGFGSADEAKAAAEEFHRSLVMHFLTPLSID